MSSQPPPSLPGLPQIGDLLVGKYRVERVLGQGGMGIVYAAQHELLCQRVAVKLLLNDATKNAEATSRFLNEARAAARIQNENVARVSDVGLLESGTPYMVMEFLEGADLSQVVSSRGPLLPQQAVDYLLQALEAIAQAHALGIVHRDLKPANLFLAQRIDGTSLVKVLDFGISKSSGEMGALSSGANTSTQALLGSPYYMSPEQLRSSKNVDRRTDIWSLGVILYELLVGATPYQEDSLGGLFAAILEKDPPPIRLVRPDVPVELEAIYRRCLTRNPDGRFQSAQELAHALGPFATARGHASIDRILGTQSMSRSGADVPRPSGFIGPQGPAAHGQTASTSTAAWGQSSAVKSTSRAPLFTVLALGLIVMIGGGIFLQRLYQGTTSTSPTSAAPVTTSAETATAPVVAPVAPAAPAPTPSVAATEAPSAAETAPVPSESATAAPAEAPVQVKRHRVPPSSGATKPSVAPHPNAPAATPAPAYDPSKDARH